MCYFCCRLAQNEYQLLQRATEKCGIHRSLSVVGLLWFSSCNWKCCGAMVVLQKPVFTNNLKPIFSLVVRIADLIVGFVVDPTWIAVRCWIQPSESQIIPLNSILDMLWIHTTAATVFNLCCVSFEPLD